jgi:hypothetical protein
MKAYLVVDIDLQAFLTSARDSIKWSASGLGHFSEVLLKRKMFVLQECSVILET